MKHLIFLLLFTQLRAVLSVVQMAQAEAIESGLEVNIRNALPGRSLYRCLDCSERVFAVMGREREHHFRHAAQDTSCRGVKGSQESVEHRIAKQKIAAVLRSGGVLFIKNCNDICRRDCRSVVRLLDDERVEVEYRLPHDQGGVADLAIVPANTNVPRMVLEVYHSHRTLSRHGPWHELDAKEIIGSRYNAKERTMTLQEQRQKIPKDRGCLAYAFKDLVHLAGFHEDTITKHDTFKDELHDHWQEAIQNADPSALAVPKNGGVKAKVQWFLNSDSVMHGFFRYMNKGVDTWAKGFVEDSQAMHRAHNTLLEESRCIGCERSFENEGYKLCCKKCIVKRYKQRKAYEEADQSD